MRVATFNPNSQNYSNRTSTKLNPASTLQGNNASSMNTNSMINSNTNNNMNMSRLSQQSKSNKDAVNQSLQNNR